MFKEYVLYKIILLFISVFVMGCGRVPVADYGDDIRIVSLAPNITEAIFAVGAGNLMVGRTSACNYPAEAESVAVIGGFGVPSLEMLAKVRPTLVLDSDLADEAIGARIDAMGIRRKRVDCSSLDGIPEMMREIGVLTGHEVEGEKIASEISVRLAELRSAEVLGTRRVKVYAEVWHDPMTTTGAGTVLSDLIALAGGVNIGDAARKSYFQMSPEKVLSADPDVILCLYMGKNEGAAEALKLRPGWQHLRAVKNNAVYDGLDNDILLRAGPRILEGVDLLKKCFREHGAGGGEHGIRKSPMGTNGGGEEGNNVE